MKDVLFYLGLALLLTHEMDAMLNHEWLVLPLTSFLADPVGQRVFLLGHIPLFALLIGLIASLNLKLRARARYWTSAFLVIHAGLHTLFSGHDSYEFASLDSSLLIYGAALVGAAYLVVVHREKPTQDQ